MRFIVNIGILFLGRGGGSGNFMGRGGNFGRGKHFLHFDMGINLEHKNSNHTIHVNIIVLCYRRLRWRKRRLWRRGWIWGRW